MQFRDKETTYKEISKYGRLGSEMTTAAALIFKSKSRHKKEQQGSKTKPHGQHLLQN